MKNHPKLKTNILQNEFRGGLMSDEILVYFYKNFKDKNISTSSRKKQLTIYNSLDKFEHGSIRISDHWKLKNSIVFDMNGDPYVHEKDTIAVGIYDQSFKLYKIIAVYPKLTKPRFDKYLIEMSRIDYDCTNIRNKFSHDADMLQHVLNDRLKRFENICDNANQKIVKLLENKSIKSLELEIDRKKKEQFSYKQKLNRLKINL